MNHPLVASSQEYEYAIKLLNGPDKGSVYKIISSTVQIGRSSDNDIVLLGDSKCSRNHAQIIFNNEGVHIIDISKRDQTQVNGQKVTQSPLNNHSIIQLGDTKLQFIISLKSSQKNLSEPQLGLLSPQGKNPRKGSPKKKKDKKFYLILAVLALLVFVVLSSNNEKKENPLENINNEEAINQESEKNKQLLESYRKQAKKSGKNTLSYEQAQASYLIGFRDFEHGLYNRAIDAFQACLSIQPQHILCNRYIQLSQTKFDELIQYKMIIGRQYKEQNQFQACKKAFENIMFMVKDRSNKVYSEAKENYDYCSTMIKGQF